MVENDEKPILKLDNLFGVTNPLVPVWTDNGCCFCMKPCFLWSSFLWRTPLQLEGAAQHIDKWLAASRKWEISNKIWNAINKSWLDRTANPAAFTLASRVFFSLLLCSKHASGQCVVHRAYLVYLKNDPKVWTDWTGQERSGNIHEKNMAWPTWPPPTWSGSINTASGQPSKFSFGAP